MDDKLLNRVGCGIIIAAALLGALLIGLGIWGFIEIINWITSK